MPVRQDAQLEKLIDETLKKSEFQSLEEFLQGDINEDACQKCTKQFINKLDKVIRRELDKNNVKNASLVLSGLHKFGKTLSIQAADGVTVMIKQGLWFEKARDIWVEGGQLKSEALLNLTEDFFDALMVVYENSSEGKKQVIGSFLHRTGELIADSGVHITIQQEAVRKLNMILDEIPKEDKTQILSSGKVLCVMSGLGKRILIGGDYDLQVAITEALCRMTTGKQRQELADQWFTMEFVANAFKGIKDSEFETDCRKFLNLVNGMLGDRRSVYTYPCLKVFLDEHELLMPADDKLQDFWIDFNVGSQSITFYISPDDDEEETQWETVCLPEDEVEKYLVEEKDGNNLLKVSMKHPLNVSGKEGSQIQIYFSAALNIAEAIKNVYGAIKAKEFVGKCGSSVAKTTVRIIFDEDGSQLLVPESQVSLTPKSYKRSSGREKKRIIHYSQESVVPPERTRASLEQTPQLPSKLDTPAKMRVSEATLAISSCGGSRTAMSPIARVMTTSTPARKGKVKPALELVGSSKRNSDYNLIKLKSETPIRKSPGCIPAEREYGTSANNKPVGAAPESSKANSEGKQEPTPRNGSKKFCKQIPAAKVAEMLQEDQDNARASEEEHLADSMNIVPDSQPVMKKDKTLLPGPLTSFSRDQDFISRRRVSVSGGVSLLQQGQSFQNRVSKQRAFSAAFNDQSPPQLQRSKEPSQNQVQELLAEKLEKPNKEKKQKRKHEADGKRSSGETRALEENQAAARGIEGQGQAPLAVQKAENSAVQCSKSNKKPALGSSRKEAVPQEMSPARNHRDSVSHRQENLQRGREREMEVSYREMKEKKTKSIGKDCIGVTETMISSISSKYRTQTDPSVLNRSHLEKSWSFSFLEKGQTGNSGFLKGSSHSKQIKMNAVQTGDDIYNFSDESTGNLGANDTRRLEKSGKSDKSGKSEESRIKSGSLEKGECKKPGGRYVKKHLFSDTDTEPRPDDSRNEVSWLQDYNRRPKPNVVDYSRQQHGKPPPSPGNDESPEFPPAIPKPRKEKEKAKKKVGGNENAQKDKAVPTRQTGRPQRAAAKGRQYWEPSESGSDVESVASSQEEEQSVYKPKQHPAKTNQERNKKVSAPPEQKKSAGALPQVTMRKELQKTWISQFSPLTSPPPSIEKMRCTEKSKVVARPTVAAAAAAAAPALPDLTPKPKNPHETPKQIHPKKFYKSNKSKLKAPSPPPSEAAAKSPKIIVQDIDDVSPLLSPVVMPLLTSTILKKSLVSEKDLDEQMKLCLEIQDSLEQAASSDNECAISVGSHSNSSDKIALYTEREKTPSSFVMSESSRRHGARINEVHVSGPSVFSSATLKRLHVDQSENCSEEEDEEEEPKDKGSKLRPRKLFKSDASARCTEIATTSTIIRKEMYREDCASSYDEEEEEEEWSETERELTLRPKKLLQMDDQEVQSTISSHMVSTVDMSSWETSGNQDMGMMCQKFSTDLKRKFQNRSRKMEYYTKQSLQSVQQHLSSVSVQVRECRVQKLESFMGEIMDELNDFEKDTSTLKNMEKELTNFWKKQTQELTSHQEKEQRRIHHLKTSFEKNVRHSLEYEGRIFTSEMHLMRKDMNTVQERFLKEMQEEELLGVRRGLQSLFLPKGRKF
ncbi:synaptonemal complex protein 2-like [Huso huso]|uniref:Synaptonemal complex protein 2-like n=1 Tax=Huso huso TaxID=61971 RepID=A0ABR0YGH6_HUSHU